MRDLLDEIKQAADDAGWRADEAEEHVRNLQVILPVIRASRALYWACLYMSSTTRHARVSLTLAASLSTTGFRCMCMHR